MINEENLRLAIKHIREEPNTLDMNSWVDDFGVGPKYFAPAGEEFEGELVREYANVCGTTMCLAGHLVHQAGYSMGEARGYHDTVAYNPVTREIVGTVYDVATELAGFNGHQADEAFNSFWVSDADDMADMLTSLTGINFKEEEL